MFSQLTDLSRFINEIYVKDLYDLYTYSLRLTDITAYGFNRLFILYGDNGSGKTTLLLLIFNLLSQAKNRGHRTFIAETPFREFSVSLVNGVDIKAIREGAYLTGSYRITINYQNSTLFDHIIKVSTDGTLEKKQSCIQDYINILSELRITLFFLGDDRKSQSSIEYTNEFEEHLYTDLQYNEYRRSGRLLELRDFPLKNGQILELAATRFHRWAQHQAFEASNAGEANTNGIYADIVHRIAQARGVGQSHNENDATGLHAALSDLEHRSQAYNIFGLVPPLDVTPFINDLVTSPAEVQSIIASVLDPYVRGIEARLNALERLQKMLTNFTESLNSFITGKTIKFSLTDGIVIKSRNGQTLEPHMLSSGERQLLLLFCNTALARDHSSIFLIDEPEISLNVKWQRQLLNALLELTEDSSVQFIIATHSLEILSQYHFCVRKLNPNLNSYQP